MVALEAHGGTLDGRWIVCACLRSRYRWWMRVTSRRKRRNGDVRLDCRRKRRKLQPTRPQGGSRSYLTWTRGQPYTIQDIYLLLRHVLQWNGSRRRVDINRLDKIIRSNTINHYNRAFVVVGCCRRRREPLQSRYRQKRRPDKQWVSVLKEKKKKELENTDQNA